MSQETFRSRTTGDSAAEWMSPRNALYFTKAFDEIRMKHPYWAGPAGPIWSRLGHWALTIRGCEQMRAANPTDFNRTLPAVWSSQYSSTTGIMILCRRQW